ncbi:trypsin-like peptidase domain-containing protein [Weissella diestrammenae]|uniref:Trypsin-like peptidase domain-containing protein n=1 Tax=Weissella diestrammenae TaxID=1162633 RepID=A0A7G9T7I8_9LACO|nr:trypsin-like peptidase domain-containing protein [Weissella diestrammenae]MCM0582963.1 trypsin-like peptidase domain-containing protein [Weissella diestrammenae]QNN76063.1 trypsin-like peptidase domain-containing protein [Weissella diestrammenae]
MKKINRSFQQFWQGSSKVVVIALVAGIIGGGAGAFGIQQLNAMNSTVTVGKTTPVKVADTNVKGESAATKAFKKTSGAVVSVINLQKQKSSGLNIFGEGSDESTDSSTTKSSLETASEGSGVIYKKTDNTAYVVTNNHVVEGSNALQVLLSDGTKLTGTLVGTDNITDLAVIKIKADKVSEVAQFANSNEVQAGESVLAIGSPLGSEYATSVTEGIISATKREVAATDESGNSLGKATVMQTDAAINPGNSGGALINLAGQVVGINSMKLASSTSGTSVEGMGFAIPSNIVVNIINQLEKDGKVSRPALGIKMIDLVNVTETDQKEILKLPESVTGGVVVMSVVDNTPAKTLGLKKYDVITKIDDKAVSSSGDLRDILYAHKTGDTVKITYYRDGKVQNGEVKLTATTAKINK